MCFGEALFSDSSFHCLQYEGVRVGTRYCRAANLAWKGTCSVNCVHALACANCANRWLSWGVVSLLESRCAFGAAVCKIQARKCYIKSLPPVPKIKEAVSLKVKGPLYSYLLIVICPLEVGCLIDIWKPYIGLFPQGSLPTPLAVHM